MKTTKEEYLPEVIKQKRQRIFAAFDEIEWKGDLLTTDEIVELVREGRDELDRRTFVAWGSFNGDSD